MSASSTEATWLLVPEALVALAGAPSAPLLGGAAGLREAWLPERRPNDASDIALRTVGPEPPARLAPPYPKPRPWPPLLPLRWSSFWSSNSSRSCCQQSGCPSCQVLNEASTAARIAFTVSSICSADVASQVVATRRVSASDLPEGSPFIAAVAAGGGGRCANVAGALRAGLAPAVGRGACSGAAAALAAAAGSRGGAVVDGEEQLATSAKLASTTARPEAGRASDIIVGTSDR